MRTPITLAVVLVLGAGVAGAGRDHDVHVTVTAGQGRLGIAALQISTELRAHFGAPSDRGVLVDRVRPNSPAERAGLRVGDLVLELDGEPTESATDMLSAIGDRKKGDRIAIVAWRNGQRIELTATLETDPAPVPRGFGRIHQLDSFDPRDVLRMPRAWEHLQKDLRERIEQLEQRFDKLERDATRT